MVFVQKWPFFQLFFFRKYRPGNVFYDILERKSPFSAIKTSSSKERKIDIFVKGLTHGFGPKMANFSNLFFLGNIGQENVFYDILERINAFLGYKPKTSKSRKNDIFLKELTRGFGPKMAIFPTFFFFRQWRRG